MKFFDRWRTPDVRADVGSGFWVAEAPSMQAVLRSTMTSAERRQPMVPARLHFAAGMEERVVVLWRDTIAGFVPGDRATALRAQLTEAGDARLVADGEVREHAGLWRLWVGHWPPAVVPEPPVDEIAVEPTRILGIPLTGRGTP
ncbi:MAG TPA: hypothetical protein H9815_06820 [Candidatus Ruania gallistercoris]|uniref:Uncharacterized protein n=1 Tax=Candidatus Ruania gallistercoris TaxID=2838746 RepID=A0A9D2ECY0_9MICO|nr:hypothetical protein [Candidatus Ruania gallistercoris]